MIGKGKPSNWFDSKTTLLILYFFVEHLSWTKAGEQSVTEFVPVIAMN